MTLWNQGQRNMCEFRHELLALKMAEEGHELRNVGGHQKMERQKNAFSPKAFRKEHSFGNNLDENGKMYFRLLTSRTVK